MEEKNKKPGSFFNRSLGLRIVSLFCAIFLWFYVSEVESPTSEKSIDSVAVSLRNKDIMMNETGLSVISDAIYETNIVLSGKKSTLNKIDYEDIKATVDMSKLTESGTHELPITVVAPAGTTVSSVNPRYITVTIDKTIAKPIEIETDIYYSTTYEIGDPIITDAQSKALTDVTVTGPATEVNRVHSVVARVDFGVIRSEVEAKTDLICLDINGEEISETNIKLTPQSVVIRQPVYMTKTLPLTASQANNTFANNQISFKVKPSTIDVKGDPKILEELDEIRLDPINERVVIGEALTNTVNSLIKLPENIELLGMQNTATITVNVKNVKKHNFNITPENITVTNLPDFLDIKFEDFNENILIINASDKPLTMQDIKLELDLTNYLSSGIYTAIIVPEFVDDSITYAYFPYESGYSVNFELIAK